MKNDPNSEYKPDPDKWIGIPDNNLKKIFKFMIDSSKQNLFMDEIGIDGFVTKFKEKKYQKLFDIQYDEENKQYVLTEEKFYKFIDKVIDDVLWQETFTLIYEGLVELYWNEEKKDFILEYLNEDPDDQSPPFGEGYKDRT